MTSKHLITVISDRAKPLTNLLLGNVAPCVAFPPVGKLRESSYQEILSRFNRTEIQTCSDCSTCNQLDGRVVETILRHPITAWRTPLSF